MTGLRLLSKLRRRLLGAQRSKREKAALDKRNSFNTRAQVTVRVHLMNRLFALRSTSFSSRSLQAGRLRSQLRRLRS